MTGSVIFHHPLPIEEVPTAGSRVRPSRMVEALRELGLEVEVVAGYSAERAAAAERLLRDARRGRRFRFVYAESGTAPNALNDPDHLPRRPLLDARFLAELRRAGVPIGLFYRDIYWRFEVYRRGVPFHRRLPAIAMYWFDWLAYRRAVDHLFLPSDAMADVLPTRWPAERRSELPPGCVPIDPPRAAEPPGDTLRILYVGGIRPPVHDLTPLVRAVAEVTEARLTICCPPGHERALPSPLPPRIDVVHAAGDRLPALYGAADVASVVFAPISYRRFAMPVKLFEALGYGVPAVGLDGTGASAFIEREGVGLVATEQGLPDLLRRLARDRAAVEELRRRARQVRMEHTWRRRAERVVEVLTAEPARIPERDSGRRLVARP